MATEYPRANGLSCCQRARVAIAETERATIVRQALGDHVFDHSIELKKKEWDDYRTHLLQNEIDRYLLML
jgi:glutamine synthetase